MPGTVNDFMERFGGAGTIDDQEATHYYDRFASRDPRDADFENEQLYEGTTEYLGQLPDDEFQGAARDAFAQADDDQRQGLAGGLLGALQGRGVDLGMIGGMLGLNTTDPRRMDPDEYARLANYARRQHPDAMREVVREQPWFVKALGNPLVGAVLGMVASRMLRNRTR